MTSQLLYFIKVQQTSALLYCYTSNYESQNPIHTTKHSLNTSHHIQLLFTYIHPGPSVPAEICHLAPYFLLTKCISSYITILNVCTFTHSVLQCYYTPCCLPHYKFSNNLWISKLTPYKLLIHKESSDLSSNPWNTSACYVLSEKLPYTIPLSFLPFSHFYFHVAAAL